MEELELQLAQRVEELENKVNVCYHKHRHSLAKILPRSFLLLFKHNSYILILCDFILPETSKGIQTRIFSPFIWPSGHLKCRFSDL